MEWYLIIFISALLLSFSSIIKKKILFKEHSMQFLTPYLTIFFILCLFLIPKVSFKISAYYLFIIFLKSSILFFAALAFTKTFKHRDISQVTPLTNLSLIPLTLFSFLLLGEILNIYSYIGITLILIGTYLVEINPNLDHPIKPIRLLADKYSIYLIIYLVLISLSAIMDKYVLSTIDVYTYMFFIYLFMMIIAWSVQIIFYDGLEEIKRTVKPFLGLLVIASILNFFSDLTYLTALTKPGVFIALVIPLKRISTLVTSFLGGKMFHEKHLLVRIVGTIIMLLGIMLILS